jgi:hypothetical protein
MNLPKYKRNLHIEGNRVISYITHVATIDRASGTLWRHGYWSVTTSKHINYVAACYGLTVRDDFEREHAETASDEDTGHGLKTVAMVAALGDIFGRDKKESNDWKARMLKAGIPEGALHMPEDWDTLDEEEKERRLNGAIAALKEE